VTDELWEVQSNGDVFSTDLATLRSWIEEGRVGPEALVRKGNLPWLRASETPPLRGIAAVPAKVREAHVSLLRSKMPQVPTGIRRCPACAEEIQAAAVRCRHCGSSVMDSGWKGLLTDYSAATADHREHLWLALDDSQRSYLSTLLAQPPSVPTVAHARGCPFRLEPSPARGAMEQPTVAVAGA
jgi:hypothetical protein